MENRLLVTPQLVEEVLGLDRPLREHIRRPDFWEWFRAEVERGPLPTAINKTRRPAPDADADRQGE